MQLIIAMAQARVTASTVPAAQATAEAGLGGACRPRKRPARRNWGIARIVTSATRVPMIRMYQNP